MKSLQNNLHTPPSGQSDQNHLHHPAHHRSPNNPETAWPEQCQDHRCLNDRHAGATTTDRGRWVLPETRAALHEAYLRLYAASWFLEDVRCSSWGNSPPPPWPLPVRDSIRHQPPQTTTPSWGGGQGHAQQARGPITWPELKHEQHISLSPACEEPTMVTSTDAGTVRLDPSERLARPGARLGG